MKDSAQLRIKLAKLVQELKAKRELKARSKIKQIAIELAKRRQVIYGSAVPSLYTGKITPKDIDISAKEPRKAAEMLQKELLKKGIRRKIREKYIPTLRRKIYEIGGVSYSPITKRKQMATILQKKQRLTALQQEVLNLAGTISEPKRYYRYKKDVARLEAIGKKLKKDKREEYFKTLEKLKAERVARQFLYTRAKAEKLRKQKIFIEPKKDKFIKTYPKTKAVRFI